MKQLLTAAAVSVAFYAGNATANDFPTQARVEYVLACMNERGEQSYDTLYPCVCIVDRIASSMPYREFVEAETLTFLFSTPGEKGGVFRDAAPESRKRIKALKSLRKESEAACHVARVASSQ